MSLVTLGKGIKYKTTQNHLDLYVKQFVPTSNTENKYTSGYHISQRITKKGIKKGLSGYFLKYEDSLS